MSLKLKPIILGTGPSTIFQTPSGVEASVHGLVFANNTNNIASFTLSVFYAAENTTITLADSIQVFGRTTFAWPRPINMGGGDTLSAQASSGNTIAVTASIFIDEAKIRLGFTPRGEWNSSFSYSQNDVVSFNSSSFVSKGTNTDSQPDTSPEEWVLLSSVGFTGSQGITGFTGSQGITGFTGSQGITGFTGSQGFTGSSGIFVSETEPVSPSLYDIWLDIS
jgi:hypothetical protein